MHLRLSSDVLMKVHKVVILQSDMEVMGCEADFNYLSAIHYFRVDNLQLSILKS